ncbi:hypothetical protein BC628DRAFT_669846 [Trametes gibbosa]|nr:hypothetical protein BC628DRAFT_669846 [Trametes gibbosa]
MSGIFPSVSRAAFKRAIARPLKSTTSVMPRFYSSTGHDNDPAVLEREKRRNLNKEQHKTSTPLPDHAPGWNESLASESEAAVKADQWSGSSAKELQEETVKYVSDRHRAEKTTTASEPPSHEPGVSTSRMTRNGPDSPEAPYKCDEVDGPLKNARTSTVKEKVEHKEDVITRKTV